MKRPLTSAEIRAYREFALAARKVRRAQERADRQYLLTRKAVKDGK